MSFSFFVELFLIFLTSSVDFLPL